METNRVNAKQSTLVIRSQYIKDMSIELPLAPEIFAEMKQAPDVHVDINIQHREISDGSHEIVLNAKMDALVGEKKLFIVDLSYAANAEIDVPAEQLEPVLYIEMPRLLFPFVRSIVANSLSAAGLPPMLISPIDFVALYQAKKAKEEQNQSKK